VSITASYAIEGMTCSHCIEAVRSELAALPGVTEVDVDLDHGRATVTSAAPIDHDVVVAAVSEAGYEVGP